MAGFVALAPAVFGVDVGGTVGRGGGRGRRRTRYRAPGGDRLDADGGLPLLREFVEVDPLRRRGLKKNSAL